MNKHSDCGCHSEATHKCHTESSCGCHNKDNHSCHSECGCGCHGAEKTEGNNQWVSPPSAKSYNANTTKCEKKEKTAYNNQWT